MRPPWLELTVLSTSMAIALAGKRANVVIKGTTVGPGFVRKEGKRNFDINTLLNFSCYTSKFLLMLYYTFVFLSFTSPREMSRAVSLSCGRRTPLLQSSG